MNVRRVDNELINGDIVTPVMSYATFKDDVTECSKDYIVTSLNEGHKMLQIYEKYVGGGGGGTNCNISTICEMLLEMDEVFRSYERERYNIKKRERKESHV